jgi:Integrase zinc binding domain
MRLLTKTKRRKHAEKQGFWRNCDLVQPLMILQDQTNKRSTPNHKNEKHLPCPAKQQRNTFHTYHDSNGKAVAICYSHEAPTTQGQHGLRVYDDGAVWIPSTAIDMQLRICVAAHCGSAGHRRKYATLANLESHVRWSTMANDVQQFLEKCLLCKATEPGEFMPVPFAETLHSDKPGEILHFYFLYKWGPH